MDGKPHSLSSPPGEREKKRALRELSLRTLVDDMKARQASLRPDDRAGQKSHACVPAWENIDSNPEANTERKDASMICFKCDKEMSDPKTIFHSGVCFDCMLRHDLTGFACLDRRRGDRRTAERQLELSLGVKQLAVQLKRPSVHHPTWMSAQRAAEMAADLQEVCANSLKLMGTGARCIGFFEQPSDTAHKIISVVFKSRSRQVVVKATKASLRDRRYAQCHRSLTAQLAA